MRPVCGKEKAFVSSRRSESDVPGGSKARWADVRYEIHIGFRLVPLATCKRPGPHVKRRFDWTQLRSESAKHEPIVLERDDWRVTLAICSCGAELQLTGKVGSVKEQSKKLVVAFQKHKIERETALQEPV